MVRYQNENSSRRDRSAHVTCEGSLQELSNFSFQCTCTFFLLSCLSSLVVGEECHSQNRHWCPTSKWPWNISEIFFATNRIEASPTMLLGRVFQSLTQEWSVMYFHTRPLCDSAQIGKRYSPTGSGNKNNKSTNILILRFKTLSPKAISKTLKQQSLPSLLHKKSNVKFQSFKQQVWCFIVLYV